jgi:hypothetical protein
MFGEKRHGDGAIIPAGASSEMKFLDKVKVFSIIYMLKRTRRYIPQATDEILGRVGTSGMSR